MWNRPELQENFDIIIDDGLHQASANVCFFENSVFKLKKGGYFIIEDIKAGCMPLLSKKIKEWKTFFPHLQFNMMTIPSIVNNSDNRLMVAQFCSTKLFLE